MPRARRPSANRFRRTSRSPSSTRRGQPQEDSDPRHQGQGAGQGGTPRHRLVAIGDSLTHGFQSGAIFNTDLSYPAIIARELGWYDQFRHPHYPAFGGIPLNIELLIRDLEDRFGDKISWWERARRIFRIRQRLAEAEHWWDAGPGSRAARGHRDQPQPRHLRLGPARRAVAHGGHRDRRVGADRTAGTSSR